MSDTRSKRALEASEHEAKAKALRRAEQNFWKEVKEREDEIKECLDISDKFEEICQRYDVWLSDDKEALFRHIISDAQIDYYNRKRSRAE